MSAHFSQCFASHQTIAPGDKCYAMAIRQQSTYSTVHMAHNGKAHEALGISHAAIYPDAYWTTVSNFIEGVYSINGDIDITENAENIRRLLVFVKLMLKNGAVVAEGDNSTHELAFNLPQYLVENAPSLKSYLEQARPLTAAQSSEMFSELVGVWTHVDDVAFKHRVFYADCRGRMRPLQFTLMHKRCYDDLLGQVGESHSPKTLFDKGLEKVAKNGSLTKTRLTADIPVFLREAFVSMAGRTFLEPLGQIGQFDSIDFNEEELGFGEFVVDYLDGKLSRAELFKRTAQVAKDRLVMHLLENYKVKLAPKCIWHEDGKNEFGKGYADFVSRVSDSVTKGRRNKRRT